jgi:hypothetical protein
VPRTGRVPTDTIRALFARRARRLRRSLQDVGGLPVGQPAAEGTVLGLGVDGRRSRWGSDVCPTLPRGAVRRHGHPTDCITGPWLPAWRGQAPSSAVAALLGAASQPPTTKCMDRRRDFKGGTRLSRATAVLRARADFERLVDALHDDLFDVEASDGLLRWLVDTQLRAKRAWAQMSRRRPAPVRRRGAPSPPLTHRSGRGDAT